MAGDVRIRPELPTPHLGKSGNAGDQAAQVRFRRERRRVVDVGLGGAGVVLTSTRLTGLSQTKLSLAAPSDGAGQR